MCCLSLINNVKTLKEATTSQNYVNVSTAGNQLRTGQPSSETSVKSSMVLRQTAHNIVKRLVSIRIRLRKYETSTLLVGIPTSHSLRSLSKQHIHTNNELTTATFNCLTCYLVQS